MCVCVCVWCLTLRGRSVSEDRLPEPYTKRVDRTSDDGVPNRFLPPSPLLGARPVAVAAAAARLGSAGAALAHLHLPSALSSSTVFRSSSPDRSPDAAMHDDHS
jgi:hypothetical protein